MDLLDEIVNQSRQIFDDELIGIYLHNLVLSKKQGGEWVIDNLPSKYNSLISEVTGRKYAKGDTFKIIE